MERTGEKQTGREEDKKGSAKDNRTEKERIETPIVCINIEFIRKNVLDVFFCFCFFCVFVGLSFIQIVFLSLKPQFLVRRHIACVNSSNPPHTTRDLICCVCVCLRSWGVFLS